MTSKFSAIIIDDSDPEPVKYEMSVKSENDFNRVVNTGISNNRMGTHTRLHTAYLEVDKDPILQLFSRQFLDEMEEEFAEIMESGNRSIDRAPQDQYNTLLFKAGAEAVKSAFDKRLASHEQTYAQFWGEYKYAWSVAKAEFVSRLQSMRMTDKDFASEIRPNPTISTPIAPTQINTMSGRGKGGKGLGTAKVATGRECEKFLERDIEYTRLANMNQKRYQQCMDERNGIKRRRNGEVVVRQTLQEIQEGIARRVAAEKAAGTYKSPAERAAATLARSTRPKTQRAARVQKVRAPAMTIPEIQAAIAARVAAQKEAGTYKTPAERALARSTRPKAARDANGKLIPTQAQLAARAAFSAMSKANAAARANGRTARAAEASKEKRRIRMEYLRNKKA